MSGSKIIVERQFRASASKSFWRHTSLLGQNKSFWRKGLKRGVWGVFCGKLYSEAGVASFASNLGTK